MFKVTYTYTHPENVHTAILFSEEDNIERELFLTYAQLNGLITTETRAIDNNTLVHEVFWISKTHQRDCEDACGAKYAAFVQRILDKIILAGGLYKITEEAA